MVVRVSLNKLQEDNVGEIRIFFKEKNMKGILEFTVKEENMGNHSYGINSRDKTSKKFKGNRF